MRNAVHRMKEELQNVLRGIRHLHVDGIVGIFRPDHRRLLSLPASSSSGMQQDYDELAENLRDAAWRGARAGDDAPFPLKGGVASSHDLTDQGTVPLSDLLQAIAA